MSLVAVILGFIGNLGASPPVVLAIFTALGCLIIAAKEVRLAIMMLFFFSAIEFIALVALDQDTTLHLYMILVSAALMALAYMLTPKKTENPFAVQ